MDLDSVGNRNIGADELSKSGLHLNVWGNSKTGYQFY